MKKLIPIALVASIIINLTFWVKSDLNAPKTGVPEWHPFKWSLGPLTVKSLVDSGYYLMDQPCGFSYFGKVRGDTTIAYSVDVDCGDYHQYPEGVEKLRKFLKRDSEPEERVTEKEPMSKELMDSAHKMFPKSRFAPDIFRNRYYPFEEDELEGCRQSILGKTFIIDLGKSDSLPVKELIEANGGTFFGAGWKFGQEEGFTVEYKLSDYFYSPRIKARCSVGKQYWKADSSAYVWEFIAVTHDPMLDWDRLEEIEEHQKLIQGYYKRERPTKGKKKRRVKVKK